VEDMVFTTNSRISLELTTYLNQWTLIIRLEEYISFREVYVYLWSDIRNKCSGRILRIGTTSNANGRI
jgi:hypothetical protein